eukprot:TRINITY_DN1491_c1_g1_i1.p1 TRINITY_DN1491_c1_g1~~TRINITY_DN1491_c1_g1_i1.p1  ORF type:complete len:276 (-),score=105.78 TRINITY_DN1491_c1_g1_i1:18-845(-)
MPHTNYDPQKHYSKRKGKKGKRSKNEKQWVDIAPSQKKPSVEIKKKAAPLSKRKRDITRLLKRPSLPAEMREKKEAELAQLEEMITTQAAAPTTKSPSQREVAKKNAKKYKMVKFVERKKVIRKMTQARRDIENEKDDVKLTTLKARLSSLDDDLIYTTFYPNEHKYISLYPSTPHTKEALAKIEEMRERALENKEHQEEKEEQETQKQRLHEEVMAAAAAEEEEEDAFFMADDSGDDDDEESTRAAVTIEEDDGRKRRRGTRGGKKKKKKSTEE